MNRIKQLDPTVVNRIAAGEIVVTPANALKELLENALDASATRVEIVVKDGGVKLLQVGDDGCGIAREDLPLLCQRFATSKIERFEDLASVATYGFRGEAMASISHIARLSVVTRQEGDQQCAFKASYKDGELVGGAAAPVAGKQGTVVIVEDLFYNVPSRLRSLKSAGEELQRIVDVAGRYAVHTSVGIGVKKFGDAHFALSTRPGMPIKERIRSVFGSAVANELVVVKMDEGVPEYGVQSMQAHITNANYKSKKSVPPVFFINGRLVDNDPLKRALNSTIQQFLPKGSRPFIYLALEITPQNLDVNVHPTKREVRFLFEDEIIDKICLKVTEEFVAIDSSRSFPTQSLLKSTQKSASQLDYAVPVKQDSKPIKYDYNLVRTDASQSRITAYIRPSSHSSSSSNTATVTTDHTQLPQPPSSSSSENAQGDTNSTQAPHSYKPLENDVVEVNLQSILDLREEVESTSNKKLTEIFANLSYIGIVDSSRRLAALQYDVKLMLFDYAAVFNAFFYQLGLQHFSNFGVINLMGNDGNEDELHLRTLFSKIQSNLQPDVDVESSIANIIEMREMLDEYFNIKIEVINNEAILKTLPLLLKNYIPPLAKLPIFLYKLATQVNWEDEKQCLEGILKQIALFYIPETIPEEPPTEGEEENLLIKKQELNELMENVLMPNLKKNFLAPTSLNSDVIEIANLPGLYRVFERC